MRYGTTDVLHGIDFDIRTGEVVALLGPNGTGKTTTIEIVASRPSTATQTSVAAPGNVSRTPGNPISPSTSVMTRPVSVLADVSVIFPMT